MKQRIKKYIKKSLLNYEELVVSSKGIFSNAIMPGHQHFAKMLQFYKYFLLVKNISWKKVKADKKGSKRKTPKLHAPSHVLK